MTSQIIGLGGGGFTSESSHLLDLYILSACSKPKPKICFLPTASGDNVGYIEHYKEMFSNYVCDTKYLGLMSPRISRMEEYLLDSDVIYVGGGNTKSMLGLWREWGIDKALRRAYEQGIVLAGVSAGFVCWFEQCVTDSIPGKFTSMDCLGLLKGSGCPHYGSEVRQQAYHSLLAEGAVTPGYAADDGVGLHFIDGKLVRAVSSDKDARAYYVSIDELTNKTYQKTIDTEYLFLEKNYQKYLGPMLESWSSYTSSDLSHDMEPHL